MTSGVLYAVLRYGNVNIQCFTSGFTFISLGLTHIMEELETILLYFATLSHRSAALSALDYMSVFFLSVIAVFCYFVFRLMTSQLIRKSSLVACILYDLVKKRFGGVNCCRREIDALSDLCSSRVMQNTAFLCQVNLALCNRYYWYT